MDDVKVRATGLSCKLPRGSEVFGALSEDGEFVCYVLRSANGAKTSVALSDEALAAMIVIRNKLNAAATTKQEEGGA